MRLLKVSPRVSPRPEVQSLLWSSVRHAALQVLLVLDLRVMRNVMAALDAWSDEQMRKRTVCFVRRAMEAARYQPVRGDRLFHLSTAVHMGAGRGQRAQLCQVAICPQRGAWIFAANTNQSGNRGFCESMRR